jgi:hypothetical protein
MQTIQFVSLAAALTMSASFASAAEKRPVVCLNYAEATMPVDGVAQKVAICADGKRPVVLTSITFVTIASPDGTPVKAVVGYR